MDASFVLRKQFGKFACMLPHDSVDYLRYIFSRSPRAPSVNSPILVMWMELFDQDPLTLNCRFRSILEIASFPSSDRLREQIEAGGDFIIAAQIVVSSVNSFESIRQDLATEIACATKWSGSVGISLESCYNALVEANAGELRLTTELADQIVAPAGA